MKNTIDVLNYSACETIANDIFVNSAYGVYTPNVILFYVDMHDYDDFWNDAHTKEVKRLLSDR